MSTKVGPIIKTIINLLDEKAINDYKKFLSVLDDLAPELTNERKIFHRVITQETLSFLLKLNDSANVEGNLLRAKKRLEDEYGLSESWSVLIVSSFADALGIPSIILECKDDEKSVQHEHTHISQNQITKIMPFSSDGTVSGMKIYGTTFLKEETS